MSNVAKGYGAIFTSVQKTVKTSSGSAVNIVICLATVGSEQLFSFAVFNCPCPRKTNDTTGVVFENCIYGWVFIIVPAFALFVLGYAMNIKTWKLTTGCCKRHKQAARGYSAGCSTVIEIFVQALVAPVAWSSVAFLDGNYYACASTAQPYREACELVLGRTSNFKYSIEYKEQERQSKIIGWCLIAATLFLGSIFYMIHRCLSPLTYHHRKYARWYTEIEAKLFEEKARAQIEEEINSETLNRFFEKKRKKSTWDKISTVFTFTRDDKNFALYSRLDEWHELKWLKEQKNNQEKEDDPTVKLLEDSPCVDPLPDNNNVRKDSQEEAELNSVTVDENIRKESQEETGSEEGNQSTSSSDQQLTPMKKSNLELIEMQKIPPPPCNKNAGKRKVSVCSANDSEEEPSVTSHPIGYDIIATNFKSKSTTNLYDKTSASHTLFRNGVAFSKNKKVMSGNGIGETVPLM